MTLFIETGAALPEAARLNMRGVQTDPYGEILGGHLALFDFALPSTPDSLALDDEIPNLVRGGAPAICTGAFGAGNTAAKGLKLTASTSGEFLQLPETFDLLTLGSTPSFMLPMWLTSTAQDANLKAIVGHATDVSPNNQWIVSARDDYYLIGFDNSLIRVPVTPGETNLLSLFGRKKTEGQMELLVFKDDKVIQSRNILYPFVDADSAGATLGVGAIAAGFVTSWAGTLHRLGLIKVDPGTFDPYEWIAEEIANNAARF